MERLHFTLNINAQPQKIWETMWNATTYPHWMSEFTPGSYYKTADFTRGNSIQLLTPEGHGMYGFIDELIPHELLQLRHIGEIFNFEEQPIDGQSWHDALEIYTIEPIDATQSKVSVQVDTDVAYIAHMEERFPLALKHLARLAEEKPNN